MLVSRGGVSIYENGQIVHIYTPIMGFSFLNTVVKTGEIKEKHSWEEQNRLLFSLTFTLVFMDHKHLRNVPHHCNGGADVIGTHQGQLDRD